MDKPFALGTRKKHVHGAGHCWIYPCIFWIFWLCPCLEQGLRCSRSWCGQVWLFGLCLPSAQTLPSDPKENLSASIDHLNPNFVLRIFITLKKKSLLDQILRNNIHSGFVIQTIALCCPMGHLFKLGPQNGLSSPCPKVFLFAFNYKWTLYKDPSLPWSNWFYHLITPLLRWGKRRQSLSNGSVVLSA